MASENVQVDVSQAGGACGKHGVYVGRRCPECAKTWALAALDQAVWEATQFLSADEVEERINRCLADIERDEP